MNTLATSLLLACAGVLLAWLLGRPVRRLTGAGPAFCLWLLPPLLAAMAWLPAAPQAASSAFTLPMLVPVMTVSVDAVAPGASGLDVIHIAFIAWLLGAGLMLARLGWHCWRIARRARQLPLTMRDAIDPLLQGIHANAVRLHPAGPAVCWLPHCRLLLPTDLLQRFDRDQLTQVLAHERMHLARRDPLWSLAAEIMLAALWFFPPAWLAMRRFRLDQELACDAAIVRQSPRLAGRYARALLAGITTPHTLTATTPWLTQSQLKERLTMIQSQPRTLLKRRAGYAALIALLAGTALAAQAAMPATATLGQNTASPASSSSASVNMSYRIQSPPRYPAKARRNHEQGTVTLRVKVGIDGRPLQVKATAPKGVSQSLVDSAKEAAWKWQFNPSLDSHGKPVVGWAKIPVKFSLDESKPFDVTQSSSRVLTTPDHGGQRPVYPAKAYKNHESGSVHLLIKVGPDGKPAEIKTMQGRTHASKAMIASATKAAWTWHFKPSSDSHGKPNSHWIRVPVQFKAGANSGTAASSASDHKKVIILFQKTDTPTAKDKH